MSKAAIKLGPTRLSQGELLEAVELYLRKNGRIPPDRVGALRWRFGMIGEPEITLVGDAVDLPGAGNIYFEYSFEELSNVAMLPRRR